MDRNLGLELVRATETAALASARWMGRGDEMAADEAAVNAMRSALDQIEMNGTIVIGEGEEDEVPGLFTGQCVGNRRGVQIDIALDSLEGSTACASGAPNALSVVAASRSGGFFRVPETYMEKIAVGPEARGKIDLDRTCTENLRAIAQARKVPIQDLSIVILDRPRHEKLIAEVREAGARIHLIKDGDISAAIATCAPNNRVDVLLGTGGAAEGVIAAAALCCLGGEIQGRLMPRNKDEAERIRGLGVGDIHAKLGMEDLVSGEVIFAATGVTAGDSLEGVRFRPQGALTQSVVMRSSSGTIRYIDAEHNFRTRSL